MSKLSQPKLISLKRLTSIPSSPEFRTSNPYQQVTFSSAPNEEDGGNKATSASSYSSIDALTQAEEKAEGRVIGRKMDGGRVKGREMDGGRMKGSEMEVKRGALDTYSLPSDDMCIDHQQKVLLRVSDHLCQDHRRISLPEKEERRERFGKVLKKKLSLSLKHLQAGSEGCLSSSCGGGGGGGGGGCSDGGRDGCGGRRDGVDGGRNGDEGERMVEKEKNEKEQLFKKKKNSFKIRFPKLSRALSKSDRCLYEEKSRGEMLRVNSEGDERKGAGGKGKASSDAGGSKVVRSDSKKSTGSLLSKLGKLRKGWSKSVEVHLEKAGRKKSLGEVSFSSESSASYASSSSGHRDEAGRGHEVISPVGQARKLYYLNDSVDSAEDALATIEEHRSSSYPAYHGPATTTTNIANNKAPHATTHGSPPLPLVVIHSSDNKQRILSEANSFSDSACSPSLPGDLLVNKRSKKHKKLPNDDDRTTTGHHHQHQHHSDTNNNQVKSPHRHNHHHHQYDKHVSVQSGPELRHHGVSGSEVEEKSSSGHHKTSGRGHKKVAGGGGGKAGKNEKKKKTSSWYNVLSPSYKSRSEDFKRIFKQLPADERLLVEYSCALQKEILIQGRMYVSQSCICFYANIFRWETVVVIRCGEIIKLSKEKTARVIPNAIQIVTRHDKYFFASFGARDKVFKQLELVRRNALMGVVMNKPEFWSWVHLYYGDDLGLTSDDDDDYEPLTTEDRSKFQILLNSELDGAACQVDEASEAAVALATGHNSSLNDELKHEGENDGEEEKEDAHDGVPDDDHESSTDEDIVDFCSRHRHNNIEVLDEAYNMPVDVVFEHIFGDSSIFREFAKSNRMIDLKLNPWREALDDDYVDNAVVKEKKEGGESDGVERGKVGKRREISYTLLLNLNFGPKESPSREKQVMYAESEPGQFYLIDSDCFNDNIPYGDHFYISNRYCISRLSNKRSRLKITSQIKYKKSCWGFIKTFLAKNVTGGINSTFSTLADLLRLESDRHVILLASTSPSGNLLSTPSTHIDSYHRHFVTSQPPSSSSPSSTIPGPNDVTDHVTSTPNNGASPRRRNAASSVDVAKDSSNPVQPRSAITDFSLDTIIRSLCFLMLLLLLFNGVFFYKLWNLELVATRLIKYRLHDNQQQHSNNQHHKPHLHSNAYHNNHHHGQQHHHHSNHEFQDSVHSNELHTHSSLEELMKKHMQGSQEAAIDWLQKLQSSSTPPSSSTPASSHEKEGVAWRGGRGDKRDQYKRLLADTVRLMESLRLTMRHLQKQLGDGGGGGGREGGDSDDDDGGRGGGCYEGVGGVDVCGDS